MIEESTIKDLLLDTKGNYIVQKALSLSKGKKYVIILSKIAKCLDELNNVSYGKKLVEKIFKLHPDIKCFIQNNNNYKKCNILDNANNSNVVNFVKNNFSNKEINRFNNNNYINNTSNSYCSNYLYDINNNNYNKTFYNLYHTNNLTKIKNVISNKNINNLNINCNIYNNDNDYKCNNKINN